MGRGALHSVAAAQDWAPAPPGVVSGAGDNALERLITGDEPVVFRGDAEQVALVELKVAAIRVLPVQSVRSFFGLGHFGRRVWFYHELRPALGERTRAFWDAREATIRAGLLASGEYERAMAAFRTRILPLVHAPATIEALLACENPNAKRGCVESWRSRRWALVRRAHPQARAIDATLDGPTLPRDDYRLQWRLLGRYRDLEAGPPWLTTAGHARLRQRLDGLEVGLGEGP